MFVSYCQGFRIIRSCFRCYEEISIKSVRRLFPKSLSAEQRNRKSLAKRFQTSERFSKRKREGEGDKQAFRCLKPSVVECKLWRIIFLSISKREWPSSKINFHRTSRSPPPTLKPHYRSQFHPQIFRQMSARTSLLSHFPSTVVALFHQLLETNCFFSSISPPPRSNILREGGG